MPTIEERKFELKQKRSDALMAKINVLRAKYGSSAPPIKSMKEEHEFNAKLLFGKSGNENIDWNYMGIEGVVRCYYEIQYQLIGRVRNNIIKAGNTSGSASKNHNSSCRSGLQSAADWLTDGQGYRSGFYIGWEGLEVEANDEDDMTKKQILNDVLSAGRKGEFDVPMTENWTTLSGKAGKPNFSSTFTNNRDKYLEFNKETKKIEAVYPPDLRESSLLGIFDRFVEIIGYSSSIGPHSASVKYGSSPTSWTSYVNDTLLGKRLRDVAPYDYDEPTTGFSGGGTDNDGNILPPIPWFQDGTVRHGDGIWDDENSIDLPSGYTHSADYWDNNYNTYAQSLIDALNSVITYIGYTKVSNFDYIVNPYVLPGIDFNYDPYDENSNIGSSWSLQNGWINTCESIRDRLQQSLDLINANKVNSSTTKTSARSIINTELDQIKTSIPGWQSQLESLANTVDSTVSGDVTNPMSLIGHRFLWVRACIHPTEGTLTAVNATAIAIEMMEKKLKKAEDELRMFGIMENKFIPTPLVVGVEPFPLLDQVTGEMVIGGWLVAWGGQEHCTGYDVWKSEDYDPATKQGTWVKLEASNTQYTMSDINANTGKVIEYIIDDSVEPIPNDVDQSAITHPYYKVKAYDLNGGSGEYDRVDTQSEESEPLNPAAFPLGGQAVDTSGPRRDATTPVETADETNIPPNTLFWTTTKLGSEAIDFERMVFVSEAKLDSIASNLIVFVDGKHKNIGGDFEQVDEYTIKFFDSIPLTSEVNMIVALRSFASPNKSVKGSTSTFNDLLLKSSGGSSNPDDPDNPDSETELSSGDVYLVEDSGEYYEWNEANGEWNEVSDPNGSSVWREPVNTISQLPTSLNADGDVRLTLDTSTMYRWNATNKIWEKISGTAGGGWLSPIDTVDDLSDITDMTNGSIVFVVSEEAFFRWSETQSEWLKISGSGTSNWRDPVNTFDLLPEVGNSEGDVRLILSENKIYRWDAWQQEWVSTVSEVEIEHKGLIDSDWEEVDQHDVRYYPKSEIDETHNSLEQRLLLLESLKPKDAEPLSGDFSITGTKLYEGYLSDSESVLNYNTLQPDDYFRRIIKDTSFILTNNNTQQFRDGDKGILYCYVNGEKVDEFNLGDWFNEEERDSGQTYPRQFGYNNVIEILSVGPYNQYASYQRADFQININESLLIPGENSIKLVHEVGNLTNDIHETEDFIIFWDNFDGYMGFKEVYIDEISLTSEKYLSGVRYYSLGDELRLRFEAENLFNNSYIKDEQIYVNTELFGITPLYTNYESDDILGSPIPRIGEDLHYLKTNILDVEGIYSSKPELVLESKNPFGKYVHRKSDTNMLINTVTSKSTDLVEHFVDENYRLPLGEYNNIPTLTGQWDSSRELELEDLQLFGGELIYPHEDFSKYHPNNTVNYSTHNGPKQYIRAFRDLNPRNNGKFVIDGFNNVDANIKVDIKLPGQTGWLSLNTPYNFADFDGNDGDGCLISNNGCEYEWTTGGFSTANSGDMVLVRITLYYETHKISGLRLE